MNHSRPALGAMIYMTLLAALGLYFAFAAVQGDYGVFRQVQITAEAETLRDERDRLKLELADVENKTRRMSDDYLDIDLLDQQAREVLGYIRQDEIVIR